MEAARHRVGIPAGLDLFQVETPHELIERRDSLTTTGNVD
jgi:hypothetical protein